jgi:hypothetical protein
MQCNAILSESMNQSFDVRHPIQQDRYRIHKDINKGKKYGCINTGTKGRYSTIESTLLLSYLGYHSTRSTTDHSSRHIGRHGGSILCHCWLAFQSTDRRCGCYRYWCSRSLVRGGLQWSTRYQSIQVKIGLSGRWSAIHCGIEVVLDCWFSLVTTCWNRQCAGIFNIHSINTYWVISERKRCEYRIKTYLIHFRAHESTRAVVQNCVHDFEIALWTYYWLGLHSFRILWPLEREKGQDSFLSSLFVLWRRDLLLASALSTTLTSSNPIMPRLHRL